MIIIIPIYLFYIVNLFPGSLVQNTKYSIMLKNSNGYELAKWTNQKLDKNDVLISTHTSISLFEMKTFSNILEIILIQKISCHYNTLITLNQKKLIE